MNSLVRIARQRIVCQLLPVCRLSTVNESTTESNCDTETTERPDNSVCCIKLAEF